MQHFDIDIDKGIIELQSKLGLPGDFFKKLLHEDDWSFIIKLHALIEAACTDIILHRFKEPQLKNIISRLELSNKTYGKIAFLKELELLGDTDRRYVSSLSEWRNNFVHNVENCSASLQEIIKKMDKNQLKKFALDFSPFENTLQRVNKGPLQLLNESTQRQIDPNNLIKRASENPKFHIWIGAYNLLASLVDMYDYNEYIHYDRALQATEMYEDEDNEIEDEGEETDIRDVFNDDSEKEQNSD